MLLELKKIDKVLLLEKHAIKNSVVDLAESTTGMELNLMRWMNQVELIEQATSISQVGRQSRKHGW